MSKRLPRPEDVSRHHIDSTVMSFLNGEQDADWTETSLVTLHPRDEIRKVLSENDIKDWGARFIASLTRPAPVAVPRLVASASYLAAAE